MQLSHEQKLKISEASMAAAARFAKFWAQGDDPDAMEREFNSYVALRRMLPKEYDPNQDRIHRFESELAYLATQGEFEG